MNIGAEAENTYMEWRKSSGIPAILAAQNPDGGWPYRAGRSWTEPAAYALLALQAAGDSSPARTRGLAWLETQQRSDGGWPPESQVRQSTWVTALALLALAGQIGPPAQTRAIDWLVRQSGRESSWSNRLRRWLSGATPDFDRSETGWPWYPDTAAWVTPTALTILCAARISRRQSSPALRQRLETARRFLLARQCADGGWNHGYARGFGYDGGSYPETTGQALLALRGLSTPRIDQALARAESQLRECRTVEGCEWLRLGLLAHGRDAAASNPMEPCRTIPDLALTILADHKSPFLEWT